MKQRSSKVMSRRTIFCCFITGLLVAGCVTPVSPPPSVPATRSLAGVRPPLPYVGDIAVYRVRNAYNGEPRGDVQYRVEKIDGDRVTVAVTATSLAAALPHTEIYTLDGNWLRHPMANHDQAVDYEFSPPFPVRAFPIEAGQAWSVRVNATNLEFRKTNSVRIDMQVLGSERITTRAGAFDVFKIRRNIYAGDWDGFLRETNITELEWYAPALGRSVRIESNSNWIDTSRGSGGGGIFGGGFFNSNQFMRGDWNVTELISFQSNR
jgi:hypothetical protein